MNLKIADELYDVEYVERAVAFYKHLESHREVQHASVHTGIPVCKICNKSSQEIYDDLFLYPDGIRRFR